MTPADPPRRPLFHGQLRWAMLALFIGGVTLNYVSRNSLGILALELQRSLSMSTEQYSWVVAAFQLAYAVCQPLCGWLVDFWGVKLTLALAAAAWSLTCILHAGAGSWLQFAVLRLFMGATEAAASPSATKVLTQWFPRRESAVAAGWSGAGFSLGAMLAPPLIVAIQLQFGWQMAFVLPGVVGLVWAVVWYRLYDTPAQSGRISAGEREHILSGQPAPADRRAAPARQAFAAILRNKRFYGIALPAMLAEPAWQAMSFWVPMFLMRERGMDIKAIAMFAWLPFLAADFGSVLGGYLARALRERWQLSYTDAAIGSACVGATLMLSLCAIAYTKGPILAILLISVAGFGHQMISGMLNVLVIDNFDSAEVSTVNGLRGACAWLSGSAFTLLIGAVSGSIGFTPLFTGMGLFDLAGAALMIFLLASRSWRRAPVTPSSDSPCN